MATASPSSTTSSPSPSKANAIASFSREKLEKLFTDTVKKLRAREKELAAVLAERDGLSSQLSAGQNSAAEEHDDKLAHLQTKLQEYKERADTLEGGASVARAALSKLEQENIAKVTDLKEENMAFQEQLKALKDQMRAMAVENDGAIEEAVAPLKAELQLKHKDSLKMESMVKSARQAAGKADAHAQVLEGALAAIKSQMEACEHVKEEQEVKITQLTADLEEATARLSQFRSERESEVGALIEQISALQSATHGALPTDLQPRDVNDASLDNELVAFKAVSSAREEQLKAEIQQLTEAAAQREAEVSMKVQSTHAQLDSVLPELEKTNLALAESRAQSLAQAEELGALLAERTAGVVELEERVAKSEAALNASNALLEEREAEINRLTNPLLAATTAASVDEDSTAAQMVQGVDEPSIEAGDKAGEAGPLMPRLPDITEGGQADVRGQRESSAERLEHLESYVKQLEEENSSLCRSLEHANQGLQQVTDSCAKEVKSEQGRLEEAEQKCNELGLQLEAADAKVADLQEKLAEMEAVHRDSGEILGKAAQATEQIKELEKQSLLCEELRKRVADLESREGPLETAAAEAQGLREKLDEAESKLRGVQMQEHSDAVVLDLKEQIERLASKLQVAETAAAESAAQLLEIRSAQSASPSQAEEVSGMADSVGLQEAELEAMRLREQAPSSLRLAAAESNGETLSPIQGEASDQDAEKAKLLAEKERLANDLAESKRRFSAAAKRKQAEFVKKVKELEERSEAAERRAEEIAEQLRDARAKAQINATTSLSTTLQEREQVEAARDSAAKELAVSRKEVASLQEEVQALQSQLTEARHAASAVKGAIEQGQAASEEARTLKGEVEDLKSQLQQAREAADAAEAKAVEAGSTQTTASGEVARLTEAVESSKASLAKEKERAARFIMDLKKRLEKATKELKKAEEEKNKFDDAMASLQQQTDAQKAALLAEKHAVEKQIVKHQADAKKWEDELTSYKSRAHGLLKSKDAELRTVRETVEAVTGTQLAEAKAAAQEARDEVVKLRQELVDAENAANERLHEAESRHELTVAALREAAEEAEASADSASQAVDQWRRRFEALEGRMETLRAEKRQFRDPPSQLMQKHAEEVASLEKQIVHLQDEFAAFKETAEQIAEAKDSELERLLGVNASLRDEITVLQSRQGSGGDMLQGEEVSSRDHTWNHIRRPSHQDDGRLSFYSAGSMGASGSFANNLGLLSRREDGTRIFPGDDGWAYSEGRAPSDWGMSLEPSALQEASMLRLAEQQARREEELNAARQRAHELETEVADLTREVELRQEQEQALKEALREVEREKSRAALADKQRMDIEYLKNIVLKLYETGEAPALLPAISMLLHFSPAEVRRCQEALARQAESAADDSTTAAGGEGDVSGYLTGWASWAFGEGEQASR